jgi:UDP-glucose 4-epimerase
MPAWLDFFLNSMRKSAILIGAGFIGSSLSKHLINNDYEVMILKRFKRNIDPTHPRITYVYDDYSQHQTLANIIKPNIDVFHLAPLEAANIVNMDTLFDVNFDPFINLLKIVSSQNSRLIFFSSGGTIYGDVNSFPISETCEKNPISVYGKIKLKMEELIYNFATTKNLKYICIRPSNAFGPGQLPHTGQGFIATAIKDIIEGNQIKIFGSGDAVRDYIYIDDLVHAIFSVIKHSDSSETYNIGTGTGISLLDIIEHLNKIAKVQNLELKPRFLEGRNTDVKKNILDIRKISARTKWQPKTNFIDGLEMTFRWLRDKS